MEPWHTLTNINTQDRTAICAVCGPTKIRNKGARRWGCRAVAVRHNHGGKQRYRKHCRNECELCGIYNSNKSFFDVHHLDGKEKNDKLSVATLCPNCHRLEHLGLNGD